MGKWGQVTDKQRDRRFRSKTGELIDSKVENEQQEGGAAAKRHNYGMQVILGGQKQQKRIRRGTE